MNQGQRERRTSADEHYAEIGESLAGLVVAGGMTPAKAWGLISGTGLYRRWMLDHWIERYRDEHKKPKPGPGRPRGSTQDRRALLAKLSARRRD